jgi:hypothetical protein
VDVTDTRRRLRYVAVAVALGTLVACNRVPNNSGGSGVRPFGEPGNDEDRPPIIVKNGSLIFEIDPNDKYKKDWKRGDSDDPNEHGRRIWRTDHPNAKKLTTFVIAIEGGTIASGAPCPALSMTTHPIEIHYDKVDFIVDMKKRKKEESSTEYEGELETVVWTADQSKDVAFLKNVLTAAGPTDDPTKSVKFKATESGTSKPVDCSKPSQLKIWSF